MFEQLLIPVDGSGQSKRAAAVGLAVAERYDAHVDVLYVIEEPSERREMRSDEATAAGEAALETVAEMADGIDASVDTHLEEGRPHRKIIDNAKRNDTDLVVMGRQGRSNIQKRLLGSVTDRVLRRVSSPVLVVPGGGAETAADVALDDILLTTDGSEAAERADTYGRTVAEQFGATVHVLSVVDVETEAGVFDAGGVTEEFLDRLESESEDAVDRLLGQLGGNIDTRSAVIRGRPEETIDEYVTDHDIDLLIMASTGKSKLKGQYLGSVTDYALRTVSVPVLVVTP
ncbi:MAG: nucleotide-binding universal stress UspA family protein [Natronomonas sp.]|jgi:nucleotide-binding universal stress UspA family protein|uniref:universal stress protein n=1 Tax=Natronomonas sp. TaxID=2184060 RepID=UPI003989377C